MPRNITALGGPGTPGQTLLTLDLALTRAENSGWLKGGMFHAYATCGAGPAATGGRILGSFGNPGGLTLHSYAAGVACLSRGAMQYNTC